MAHIGTRDSDGKTSESECMQNEQKIGKELVVVKPKFGNGGSKT